MRVGLIGPYPPPKGGISVHMKRLEGALCEQGVTVTIFDSQAGNGGGGLVKRFNKLRWLFHFLTCPRVDIFHIHSSRWRDNAFIILAAKIRKIKTVVTVHSLRHELDQRYNLQSLIISFVIQHADYLIAVGENEKDKLVKRLKGEARLAILPAFIPPKHVEVELSELIAKFIPNHGWIISANGSNMNFYHGVDLYGLDMLVELCGRLHREINVGFIYCLTRVTDRAYLMKISNRIKELHIENHFLIVTENLELHLILKKSQLFLRPSCTDSYGVSIAEAIMMRIPCVASDVCKRPEGAILFQARNSEDLYSKVSAVIQNYDQCKASLEQVQIEDCTPAILKIYETLVICEGLAPTV